MPDPVFVRQAAADRATELAFQNAYRFLAQKKYSLALKALDHVYLSDPNNPHIRTLKERIQTLQADEKERAERLRAWRYYLGMNTSWKRLCWALAAVGLGLYGAYTLAEALPYAFNSGMTASITTQIVYRGRYSYRTVDWTRPIYVDLLYASAILLAAGLTYLVLISVSRGAAQWEELDSGDDLDGF
jgi:hypothetical protein